MYFSPLASPLYREMRSEGREASAKRMQRKRNPAERGPRLCRGFAHIDLRFADIDKWILVLGLENFIKGIVMEESGKGFEVRIFQYHWSGEGVHLVETDRAESFRIHHGPYPDYQAAWERMMELLGENPSSESYPGFLRRLCG